MLFGKKKQNPFKKTILKTNAKKVALCLGGGGARGFAHVGVLKALEENKISFDLVVGTSVGSLVGAFYCAAMSYAQILDICIEIKMKDVHNSLPIPNSASRLENIVKKYIGDVYFSDLSRKFIAVATDLKSSSEFIIETGSVAKAVSASCCVPFFYKPVVWGERHLVDGGLLNNIPADVARMMGYDKVVSVDINPTRGQGTDSLSVFSVLKATFNIITSNSSDKGIVNSDILIDPDLSQYSPFDKKGFMDMIDIGYVCAMEKMNDIKKLFLQ